MARARFFLACLVCIVSFALEAETLTQRRVLGDLETIRNIFSVRYAPLSWKEKHLGWNLDESIEEARDRILSLNNPSLRECQKVLRDFFGSPKDSHVYVLFHSTETASLPFIVQEAEGRYFFAQIDKDTRLPFEVGDELLKFGGEPVSKVMDELCRTEFCSSANETERALACIGLTRRSGKLGHTTPSGSIEIVGKKRGKDKETSYLAKWDYSPEKIQDLSNLRAFAASDLPSKPDLLSSAYMGFFPTYGRTAADTQFFPGSKHSYLPALGKKIWSGPRNGLFQSYIFQTESGKDVGVVRIPNYDGSFEEVREFGTLLSQLQGKTDALIIDQLSNAGGSLFYAYALSSVLLQKPAQAPKHHITLTQGEIYQALSLLEVLPLINSTATAKMILGPDIGGYPIDYDFAKYLTKFCDFTLSEWNEGNLYTSATHLFGVDKIKPHSRYRYKKPVLMLIDSLDFSCGDLVPAILQDAKRAKLMGMRTAGAGGFVKAVNFPNLSGIKAFSLTGSLAERADSSYIENLGVTPDISYTISVEDLENNYEPFKQAILKALEEML